MSLSVQSSILANLCLKNSVPINVRRSLYAKSPIHSSNPIGCSKSASRDSSRTFCACRAKLASIWFLTGRKVYSQASAFPTGDPAYGLPLSAIKATVSRLPHELLEERLGMVLGIPRFPPWARQQGTHHPHGVDSRYRAVQPRGDPGSTEAQRAPTICEFDGWMLARRMRVRGSLHPWAVYSLAPRLSVFLLIVFVAAAVWRATRRSQTRAVVAAPPYSPLQSAWTPELPSPGPTVPDMSVSRGQVGPALPIQTTVRQLAQTFPGAPVPRQISIRLRH
jgi:hypothetical protein